MAEQALDTHDAGELISQQLAEGQPEEEPKPDEVFEEETADEVEETEETTGEVEETESEEETEEAEEETSIETLTQLAEAMGVDLDQLMDSVRHQFKVGEEEIDVTFTDLVAGFKKDADYRQKTQALADQKREFEEQISQRQQAYEQSALQLGHYLNSVESMLVGAVNSDEMEALKASDPNQWMIRRQEFQDRLMQVQQYRQAAANDWDQRQQEQQQQMQAQFQEFAKREQEALMSHIPEWGDEMREGVNAFVMKQYGMTDQELQQIFDHRQVRIARDAMLYHELKAKTDAAKNKVREAPKLQKPAKAKKPMTQKTKDLLALNKRFKQGGGSLDDAAALLQQKLR